MHHVSNRVRKNAAPIGRKNRCRQAILRNLGLREENRENTRVFWSLPWSVGVALWFHPEIGCKIWCLRDRENSTGG